MGLALAGALSGAGQAGTQALATAQVQYGASKLQAERDKMENLRLDKQIGAADRRGERDIAARAEEGRLSREIEERKLDKTLGSHEKVAGMQVASQEKITDKTIGSHEKVAGMQVDSHEKITDKTLKSHEFISKDGNLSHEKIAAANNDIQLKIAHINKEMHEKQYDKTFTAARLGALKDTIRELGNEITRLSVVALNPLADKKDPSHKSLLLQLEHATNLHNLYSQQVGIEAGISQDAITGATTKKELPAYKSPTSAAQAPVRPSGGMVQVPEPPFGVTQGMVDAVERLKQLQKP